MLKKLLVAAPIAVMMTIGVAGGAMAAKPEPMPEPNNLLYVMCYDGVCRYEGPLSFMVTPNEKSRTTITQEPNDPCRARVQTKDIFGNPGSDTNLPVANCKK